MTRVHVSPEALAGTERLLRAVEQEPRAARAAEEPNAGSEAAAALAARVARFVRSVPESLRWAAQTAPEDFATELAQLAPHVLAHRAAVVGADAACSMVVLVGPSASGKTVLALARARTLVGRRSREPLFVDALDLAGAARRSGFDTCTALERAKTWPGVVVFDDLGQDLSLGPSARSAAIEVVRSRHGKALPTIVTTGLTSAEIRAQYDDALVRRLVERGRSVVVKLGTEAAL